MVKNYMECIVDLLMPIVLNDFPEICKCSKCMEDIKALSLNRIPPHYVVTSQGEMFIKTMLLCDQSKADILKEIVQAVKIVSNNPRHS